MHQSTFTPREDLSRQGTSNGGDIRRGHPVFSVSCPGFLLEDFCLVCLSQSRAVSRQTPATNPLLHPPAVLSPSAQDNSRFKHSLSHLDLEGCFAVEFFFFFPSFANARWMDGGIKWIDGRAGRGGVRRGGVAVGAVGVNSLELQPAGAFRGERVKEAAKVLGSRDLFV